MQNQKWIILIFSLSYFIGCLEAQENVNKMLNAKIPSLMIDHKVPGIALSIFRDGEISMNESFGYSNLKEGHKISEETGFNIGSISKLFTAFGVMKLVEQGKVKLDSPIDNYLKRWHLPSSEYDHSKVTVSALLSHTAGISVHGFAGFTEHDQLPTLEESLTGVNGPVRKDEAIQVILPPQSKFQYSGGGYLILQLLIEEASGLAYEEFIKQHIFDPLKMNNSTFDVPAAIPSSALPYDENYQQLPYEYWTAKGAAGMHTTLQDMQKFILALFDQPSILESELFKTMLTPTEVSKGNYGLGFRVLKLGPNVLKGHAGSNTGWQSAVFLDFDTKSGLLMLTNGDQGDDLLKNVLRLWLRSRNQ